LKKAFLTLILISQITWSAQLIQCPALKEKQPFTSLSIFDGDPKQNADLAPDNSDSPLPHKWTLDGTTPWLVCNYGPKYKHLFTQKIKGSVKSCETMESVKGSNRFDAIICEN
jgi:hypothetical protein